MKQYLTASASTWITKLLRSEGLWPLPLACSTFLFQQDTQTRVPRATSRQLLEIPKEETPQPLWTVYASAPVLAQHSPASWCSEGTSCAPECCRCLLSKAPSITEQSLAPSLRAPFVCIAEILLELLQAEPSQLSQPFLTGGIFSSLSLLDLHSLTSPSTSPLYWIAQSRIQQSLRGLSRKMVLRL